MPAVRPKQSDDIREWPIYWFARLESAIETGNVTLATRANSRLLKLGFDVKVRRPRRRKATRS